jgi:hypothetical protein
MMKYALVITIVAHLDCDETHVELRKKLFGEPSTKSIGVIERVYGRRRILRPIISQERQGAALVVLLDKLLQAGQVGDEGRYGPGGEKVLDLKVRR